MNYRHRVLEAEISRAAQSFSAILVTGPRRSGKTTLLQHLFPTAQYCLLEDLDVIGRCRADPRAFLESLKPPVILDEIQNTPELFNYLRTRIDAEPERKSQWILTGSQEAPLMRGVTESMAGRVAVFSLLPMSLEEAPAATLLSGGFPEVLRAPATADIWFRSYIQTYLERDIRAISSIRDLGTFRRFMGLLASRCGQMLNKTDLASPLGVSVPTIGQWLSILEITGQILLIPPFYENFGKRLVKSPKLYFTDTGLAGHLLGIQSPEMLATSPFRGALFESWTASEIVKHRLHRGKDKALYYFRDRQGLELDFVLDSGNRRLTLMEAKATQTPRPEDAKVFHRLTPGIENYSIRAFLVYDAGRAHEPLPLSPGIGAIDIRGLHAIL